jgi:hypothetical protein
MLKQTDWTQVMGHCLLFLFTQAWYLLKHASVASRQTGPVYFWRSPISKGNLLQLDEKLTRQYSFWLIDIFLASCLFTPRQSGMVLARRPCWPCYRGQKCKNTARWNNNNNNFIHNKIPILVYNEYITLNKNIKSHAKSLTSIL